MADNTFLGNVGDGLKVNNTTSAQIWNNTFVGNGRPLNLVQDSTRNTSRTDQAVDPRRPFPDATTPWTLGPVTVRNNVIAQSTSLANCLLCVEDYSHQRTAAQMRITADGNVYHRSTAAIPTWLAVRSRGAANRNPYVFAVSIAQPLPATVAILVGRPWAHGTSAGGDGQTAAHTPVRRR